jgi:hypothetical protein
LHHHNYHDQNKRNECPHKRENLDNEVRKPYIIGVLCIMILKKTGVNSYGKEEESNKEVEA